MKQFQIFRYLKRWLPLIVCFFIGMTLLASRVLAKKQTYTASAVIEYANGDAKEGRARTGPPSTCRRSPPRATWPR